MATSEQGGTPRGQPISGDGSSITADSLIGLGHQENEVELRLTPNNNNPTTNNHNNPLYEDDTNQHLHTPTPQPVPASKYWLKRLSNFALAPFALVSYCLYLCATFPTYLATA